MVIASAVFPGVLVLHVNNTTANLFLAFLAFQLNIYSNIVDIKDQRLTSVFCCDYKFIVVSTNSDYIYLNLTALWGWDRKE